MERIICLGVNEELYEVMVGHHETLYDILKNELGLYTAAKGCDGEDRDTRMIIMGGRLVNPARISASEADGEEIIIIEDLAKDHLRTN